MQEQMVLVLGDFLEDRFDTYKQLHKHYELIDSKSFGGGAAATYKYVRKLMADKRNSWIYDVLEQKIANALITLKRQQFDEQTFVLLEKRQDLESRVEDYHNMASSIFKSLLSPSTTIILVVSDYNKGSIKDLEINRFWQDLVATERISTIIVDSRYRTVPDSLLACAPIKIWHATGEEYDYQYAKKFDYTFHTNGADPIRILNATSTVLAEIPVPVVNIVDTTGAGDCFTASIAAYLARQNIELTTHTLIDIALYAVANCLEVIQTPYTEIPALMIPIKHWR